MQIYQFLKLYAKKEKKGRWRIGYMLKSLESISHGDVGEIGWDLVLLAESLELLPGEALEIHLEIQNKLFWVLIDLL